MVCLCSCPMIPNTCRTHLQVVFIFLKTWIHFGYLGDAHFYHLNMYFFFFFSPWMRMGFRFSHLVSLERSRKIFNSHLVISPSPSLCLFCFSFLLFFIQILLILQLGKLAQMCLDACSELLGYQGKHLELYVELIREVCTYSMFGLSWFTLHFIFLIAWFYNCLKFFNS